LANPKFLIAFYGTAEISSTWVIGVLNLPFGPSKMQFSKIATKEQIDQDGDEPINMSNGSKTSLTLSGSISETDKTDVELWNEILQPMLDLIGSEVTLVTPLQGLNGNWMLDSFEPNKSNPTIYDYTMRLSKGSLNVQLYPGIFGLH
jgi:hypothetical protein